MSNSVGIGFPSTNLQKGHIFHDLDEGATYIFIGGPPRLASSWRLLNGIFTNDPDTSLWGSEQTGATWYNLSRQAMRVWDGVLATDTKIANVPVSMYDYRTSFRVQEDFAGGTSGLYWVRQNGTQVSVLAIGFPGVTRIGTSAVISTLTSYFMTSGTELINKTYDCSLKYILRLNTVDANTQIRIGAQVAGGTINPPANGWYFEKLDADVNWFLVTRAGGVETRVDSNIVIDANFHTFEIVYTGADEVKNFYFDNQLLLSAATNSLTGAIRPAFSIINSAAAEKSFDLDYAEVEITGGIARI